jgi:uncharacterized membrane protein HdeD (DUF308 family)
MLGYLVVIFFLLSMSNGLKRFTRAKPVMVLARYHRYYGIVATLIAIIHAFVNLSNGSNNQVGLFALLSLILTGAFGALFGKFPKVKNFYLAHRIAGVVAFFAITLHVVLNII